MAERTKTAVRIAGREYMLTAEMPEEYIHKVAIYVDKKMNEVARQRSNLSTAMTAVLAAINIADEVMELRGEKAPYVKQEKPHPQPAVQVPQPPARSNIANFKEAKKV